MTSDEETIVRELYRTKFRKAFCTAAKDLTFRKWNQIHPVEENTTEYMIPKGTTLKIVMVSRFDHFGVTDDLRAVSGYRYRGDWNSGDIENIRWEAE